MAPPKKAGPFREFPPEAFDPFYNSSFYLKMKTQGRETLLAGLKPVADAFAWLADVNDMVAGDKGGAEKLEEKKAEPVMLPKTPQQKKATRSRRRLQTAREKMDAKAASPQVRTRLRQRILNETLSAESDSAEQSHMGDIMIPVTPVQNPNMDADNDADEEGETVSETPPEATKADRTSNQDGDSAVEESQSHESEDAGPIKTMVVVDDASPPFPSPVKKAAPWGRAIATPSPAKARGTSVRGRPKTPLTAVRKSARTPTNTPTRTPLKTPTRSPLKTPTRATKTPGRTPGALRGAKLRAAPPSPAVPKDLGKHEAALSKKEAALRERAETARREREERAGRVKAKAAEQDRARLQHLRGIQDKADKPATPAPKKMAASTAGKLGQKRLELRKRAEAKRLEAEEMRRKAAEEEGHLNVGKATKIRSASTLPPQIPIEDASSEEDVVEMEIEDERQQSGYVNDVEEKPADVDESQDQVPPEPVPKPISALPADSAQSNQEVREASIGTQKIRRDTFQRSGGKEKKSVEKEKSADKAKKPAVAVARPESYPMTPLREREPSTANNYNIDDMRSDDETDDESDPRKRVPSWAIGEALKGALIRQFYQTEVDPFTLFGPCYAPMLEQMFTHQRRRFHKRTSSAVWDSPLLPPPKRATKA